MVRPLTYFFMSVSNMVCPYVSLRAWERSMRYMMGYLVPTRRQFPRSEIQPEALWIAVAAEFAAVPGTTGELVQ